VPYTYRQTAIHFRVTRTRRVVATVSRIRTARSLQGGPKIGTIFVRLSFIKYYPIFKLISLSESGENL